MRPARRARSCRTGGLPSFLDKEHYAIVDAGLFKNETADFTNQISLFKNAGVEIVTGFVYSYQFASFWRESAQLGHKPEIVLTAGALLFPGGLDALSERGDGMATEMWWMPKLTLDPVAGKVDFAGSSIPGIPHMSLAGEQWRKTSGGRSPRLLRRAARASRPLRAAALGTPRVKTWAPPIAAIVAPVAGAAVLPLDRLLMMEILLVFAMAQGWNLLCGYAGLFSFGRLEAAIILYWRYPPRRLLCIPLRRRGCREPPGQFIFKSCVK